MDVVLDIVTKSWFIPTVLVTIVLGAIVWWKTKWSHLSKYKNLPPFERGLPLVGHALTFGQDPLAFADKTYKKLGPVFTIEVLGKRMTFLVGPEAQEPFFTGKDTELDQNEPYNFAVPIFGPGVVYDVPLEVRQQQLKFLRAALRTEKMKAYVAPIIFEAKDFFNQWGNKGVIDLRDELAKLIILTASRALMGDDVREKLSGKVAELFQCLDEGLTTVTMFWRDAPTPAHARRDAARLEMCELFSKIIKERREHPDVKHEDALQSFMDQKYKDGRKLRVEELAGMMIAMLFAGQHTSSVTSSWTGLFLMNNPKYLEKVLEEQEENIKKYGEDLTYEALNDMPFLHACVKEALRIHPPIIFLMRKLMVDMKICDYDIPTGDVLFTSPALSGWHSSNFEDPTTYDPYRWLGERDEDKKKKFGFIGFGGGRHTCLGEQFGYLQVKTIWSTLFRKYNFKLLDPFPSPDYTALVVGPKPCRVEFTKKE
uniref:Uncharacterized protein n=1 Tax=Paramoeba aestuarina TaxID=180227 RepID=A0A7S4NJA6_9EUKA|mmetsp:Transcript_16956/g.26447  ORF Transcript_16956/g.26447 Transcript_16956/m.26447 type:complete len:483 (+) Transcript_16956:111-1559(+)|eukprot:CAMPEP_0201518986 /NCGR_PEP_ID=MMETSP0161_2-20130828/9670_1 /ASSEMBLY_ACC=CAM_ASM_000251 /TAXON_ID=180227 /ORGANISM="Neoparamoeba aestuarina, Strain SoJaBio B1-5/56/2" /LENGTH=482 /DNA_ID=CAMNT_0047916907 /DNA_START=113 /DNA_END=1561 /DNA_ORIENTATION=+